MSRVELLDASSPWWSPFVGVLLIGLFLLACWVVIHPHLTTTYVLTVWRRGREYRRRVRAARHRRRRNSLHHLTYRSPVR